MGGVIAQRLPWTIQPQYPARIDQSNPLARGLIFSFNPAEPGLCNGVTGYQSYSTFGAAPTRVSGVKGRAINAAGGGAYWTDPGTALATKTYTYLVLADIAALDNPWGGIMAVGQASEMTFSLQRDSATSNVSIMLTASNAGLTITGEVNNIVGAGPKVLAVSNEMFGSCAYYRDGRLIQSAGYSYLPGTITTPRLVLLGERSASATYGADGSIYLALGWNRVLSAAEHASIAANPYQVFAP